MSYKSKVNSWGSHNSRTIRDAISTLKMQFSMVERSKLSSIPCYKGNMSNDVYIAIGQEVYPDVRYFIEMSHSGDIRCCQEDFDYRKSVVTFLQLHYDKSRTTMKVT